MTVVPAHRYSIDGEAIGMTEIERCACTIFRLAEALDVEAMIGKINRYFTCATSAEPFPNIIERWCNFVTFEVPHAAWGDPILGSKAGVSCVDRNDPNLRSNAVTEVFVDAAVRGSEGGERLTPLVNVGMHCFEQLAGQGNSSSAGVRISMVTPGAFQLRGALCRWIMDAVRRANTHTYPFGVLHN